VTGAEREQADHAEGPEGAEAAEYELRVLLERVVPQLPAPAQRLERIRERARRRGHRRAAALSAALVTAIAGAGLLLPRGTHPGEPGAYHASVPAGARATGTATGTAATRTAPAAGSTVSAPPMGATDAPSLTGPPYRAFTFTKPRLTLYLPAQWHTAYAAGSVFAASAPLAGTVQKFCGASAGGTCPPLREPLPPGGTVLTLTVADSPSLAGKARDGRPATPVELSKPCVVAGATEQWYALVRADRSTGSHLVLIGTVCLSHPTEEQRSTMRRVLTSADFS